MIINMRLDPKRLLSGYKKCILSPIIAYLTDNQLDVVDIFFLTCYSHLYYLYLPHQLDCSIIC